MIKANTVNGKSNVTIEGNAEEVAKEIATLILMLIDQDKNIF